MTKRGLLNSREALEELGLWNPVSKYKPNYRYLNYLAKRNLLPRFKVRGNQFLYELKDVQKLFEMAKNGDIKLTEKP